MRANTKDFCLNIANHICLLISYQTEHCCLVQPSGSNVHQCGGANMSDTERRANTASLYAVGVGAFALEWETAKWMAFERAQWEGNIPRGKDGDTPITGPLGFLFPGLCHSGMRVQTDAHSHCSVLCDPRCRLYATGCDSKYRGR